MKKIQCFFKLLLCFCFILCITACAKRTDVSNDDEFIYCLNGDKTGLVKVLYEFPQLDTVETVEAVLKELSSPAEEMDYVQPIPEEVKVQSFKIEGMLATIDFSAEYYELANVDEKLLRAAVVQSLLEVNGVIGVQFTVDGESIEEADGKIVGIMNQDDFVQSTNTALDEYQTTQLTLYFANETGDELIAEKRQVNYTSNETQEKLIMENLIEGPEKAGLYPVINPQTTLLSVTTKEDVCYINLDSDFLNRTYDVKPEVIVYSIVNSVIGGSSVKKVQITVNGEKDVTFADTVDLSKAFAADSSYIQ